jgi:hypothetical protein
VKKGEYEVVGTATNGEVDDPRLTLAKGNVGPLKVRVGVEKAVIGEIVSNAVPSTNVVMGIYNLVVI